MWASITHHEITFFMPNPMKTEWLSTDRVEFEYRISQIHLLIEKDFQCLDVDAEDQGDSYPNPLATS